MKTNETTNYMKRLGEAAHADREALAKMCGRAMVIPNAGKRADSAAAALHRALTAACRAADELMVACQA